MPKMKTKSAAKKRFKITAKGRVRFYSAYLRHNTSKRPSKMKRQNRGSQILCHTEGKIVKQHWLLG